MSNLVWSVVFIAAVIGVILVAIEDRRKTRLQYLRMKKMNASAMFAELLPMLRHADKVPPEAILIDKTGISMRMFQPAGSELSFHFREHGYANLSPEKQETLLLLMEDLLPHLGNHERYRFRAETVHLVNGTTETRYHFCMRSAYKAMLIRAPYYDGTMQQAQLW